MGSRCTRNEFLKKHPEEFYRRYCLRLFEALQWAVDRRVKTIPVVSSTPTPGFVD